MPEYTNPNTALESANTQNAGLLSASHMVRSAAPDSSCARSPSGRRPFSSGTLRTTSHATGARITTRNQPTADHVGRHPACVTAAPTLGNAAMNPIPTSSE